MKEVGIEYVLKRSSLLPVLENLWTLNFGKSPIPQRILLSQDRKSAFNSRKLNLLFMADPKVKKLLLNISLWPEVLWMS